MSIRICIVDDDPRIGDGLELLFQTSDDFTCEGTFQSSEEAILEIPRIKPDVVLMDINLRGASGIDCVRELKRAIPETQVLMLTVYEDSDRIFQSLVAGASGYLLKRAPKDQLLRALGEVHAGGAPFTSNIARKVVQYFQALPASRGLETLTAREREILEELAQGRLYKEIASRLGIALDTVRKHVRAIYEKMHVRSRSEAIVKYLKR